MALSVRMDPLLEKELEEAALRRGVTKSQFVIEAVERALGRKNPYELMVALKAQESDSEYKSTERDWKGHEQAYETRQSRAAMVKRLKAKHDSGSG